MPRAVLVALLLFLNSALAADAALSVEVPAGKSRSIRLRNLPTGTSISVRVVASARVLVALVSEKQIRSRQPDSAAPLFRAVVDRRLGFKVLIPESGDYFIVLSNRGGSAAVRVQTRIHAVGPKHRKPAAPKDKSLEETAAPPAASLAPA